MKLSPRVKVWLRKQPGVPKDFKCDFCTFCADKWFGVDLRPACQKHDWFYSRGRSGAASTREDKLMADRVFRYDCYWLMRTKFSNTYSTYFAYRRYCAVRLFGKAAFQGEVGVAV